jgi:hypothetical protein
VQSVSNITTRSSPSTKCYGKASDRPTVATKCGGGKAKVLLGSAHPLLVSFLALDGWDRL